MDRRSFFIKSTAIIAAAPAIVRAESLMQICAIGHRQVRAIDHKQVRANSIIRPDLAINRVRELFAEALEREGLLSKTIDISNIQKSEGGIIYIKRPHQIDLATP